MVYHIVLISGGVLIYTNTISILSRTLVNDVDVQKNRLYQIVGEMLGSDMIDMQLSRDISDSIEYTHSNMKNISIDDTMSMIDNIDIDMYQQYDV